MSHPLADSLIVDPRYNGPPGSGNGGYVAGLLAHQIEAQQERPEHGEDDQARLPVTVSLRQPAPLDASMLLDRREGGARLTFGGIVIADGEAVSTEIDPVDPVGQQEAKEAAEHFPGLTHHPFATCFVCGTERPDGLRIHPGRVGDGVDGSRVAAPWTPRADLSADFHEYSGSSRRSCIASTWAALDCIGAWAADFGEQLMVLGRMTAIIDDLPVVDEPHVVMGLALGRQGRKTFTASTLYDADGRIVGRAEHLWISVDAETFGLGASQ